MTNVPPEIDESSSKAGFSIVEALVAMAILAAAFLPLLDLQMQFVRTSEVIERVNSHNSAVHTANSYLSTVNMARVPSGSIHVKGGEAVWTSSLIGQREIRDSRFRLSLYEVRIELLNDSEEIIFEWRLIKNGWNPLTPYTDSLF